MAPLAAGRGTSQAFFVSERRRVPGPPEDRPKISLHSALALRLDPLRPLHPVSASSAHCSSSTPTAGSPL